MDKKGFWALLASVSGSWRTVISQLAATFRFRPAAGSDNDDLPESNGRAVINTIYGNTVKWNQRIRNGDFSNGTTSWIKRQNDGLIVSDGIASYYKRTTSATNTISQYCKTIQNHVYVVIVDIKEFNTTEGFRITLGSSTNLIAPAQRFSYKYSPGKYISLLKATENYTYIGFTGLWTDLNVDDVVFKITNFQLFDLTEIFGEGNEPSTTDEFEEWLALNVGEQDYYPHDEGSLISFKGTGIKSVGFNRWDERWEVGKYTTTTGQPTSDTSGIRSKPANYIKVFPSQTYHIYNGSADGTALLSFYVWCYDINKRLIKNVSGSKNYFEQRTKDGNITIPSNCYYIRFCVNIGYGNTYKNDICINISDPAKNGTYEPYWSDEKPFDVTKVYGQVNGEGNYVQCFPDGMITSNDVPDTLSSTVAVKNNNRKKITDINFALSVIEHAFSVTTEDIPKRVDILSSKYETVSSTSTTSILTEFVNYCVENNISKGIASNYNSSGRIYIYDDSLSTLNEFNTANVNEYIIFNSRTPITYTNLVYRDNGTDIPLEEVFPIKYKVDKYSTEELLVPASEAGEPTSTAIIADIDYQITGHNYIDDLFVDMGLPSGTLWAKCDIDITKPNGFCETPFTYEKSFFSWGNIDGHNPTSTLSFSPYDWGSSIDGEPYTSSKGNTLQANISTSKEYDAAMANLGQLFKMPTSTQFKELVDNCDFVQADGTTVIDDSVTDKRVTVNSIVGIYLKSKINGNLIFFSASGSGTGSTRNNRGAGGNYWSASFYSSRSAQNLYFNSGGVNPQNNYSRYLGFAIRPIKNQ